MFGEENIENLLIGNLRHSLIRSLLFFDFLTFYLVTEDDSRIFDDFAFCNLSCNGNKLFLSLSLSLLCIVKLLLNIFIFIPIIFYAFWKRSKKFASFHHVVFFNSFDVIY